MKAIIVIATYKAYVPEDMKVSQVCDLCEEEIRSNFEDFRIFVDDYENDEEDNCPWFELKDVKVGTSTMISVGNDD